MDSTDTQRARSAVVQAAAHYARQHTRGVNNIIDQLQAGSLGNRRTVDTAVAETLRTQVERLWTAGWLPADVYQMARRNRSKLATTLAINAIADDAARYSTALIHPRWRAQLRELDATPWWDRSRPFPGQWAERHGVRHDAMLRTAVELIALLVTLEPLPVIVPHPGQAGPVDAPRQQVVVDQKILAKVRALLAKAESTEYSDEAEALSAKAQELMARHSIEQATAESGTSHVPVASACRFWLDPPYFSAKSLLVSEVASANHARTVSYDKLGFVTVLGDDIDLETVGLLSTSLMVQATRAMLAAGRPDVTNGGSRTRSFRHAFLIAYATRIGERLRDAAQETAASTGKELDPLFAERKRAVDKLFDDLFANRVAKRSFSVGNAAGYSAGRAAADQAHLGGTRRALAQR